MNEIKRIPIKLEIKDFLVTFEYETWKGHHRKIDKRSIKHFDQQEAKAAFKKWAKSVRTISNATILDIAEIKENSQVIEL